ncbi:hypothetical protein BBP40_010152 [Aspergillus hancockii]|nr:hypothetical protein BBP40_010152 [Aspergillus hancockii]
MSMPTGVQEWVIRKFANVVYGVQTPTCKWLYVNTNASKGARPRAHVDVDPTRYTTIRDGKFESCQTAFGNSVVESMFSLWYVLDVKDRSIKNNAPIIMWGNAHHRNQRWEIWRMA